MTRNNGLPFVGTTNVAQRLPNETVKPQIGLATVPVKLPVGLARPPLMEALFEIRFQTPVPVPQLLPRVLSKLGSKYSRSEAMPVASIPRPILDSNPSFRYQPHYRLYDETNALIALGEYVAGVSVGFPYEGWEVFKPRLLEALGVLRESTLATDIERYSMKFTNLLEAPVGEQLRLIQLRAEIGGVPASEFGFRLRSELNDEMFIRIIEISTGVEAQAPSLVRKHGLMLTIDCIRETKNSSFWQDADKKVDEVHQEAKRLFFGLITESTLKSFGPEY